VSSPSFLLSISIPHTKRSLTDETIRRNWEQYGHPDGRQEFSMGIAIPKGFVEGKNRYYVLAFYGVVFGGLLPGLVGRWWFGSRQKTKDGINAKSAAVFFKNLKEDSGVEDVVGTLGKAYAFERSRKKGSKLGKEEKAELARLEKEIEGDTSLVARQWKAVKSFVNSGEAYKALVLIYAHLMRLEVRLDSLREG
jgi:translocation protein SEC63